MKMKTISLLMSCLLLLAPSPSLAEVTADTKESKELLQKGLTIYEIDREVERLNEQEIKISDQIQNTTLNMEKQNANVQTSRKHAASVLRAYYTGNRDSIWLLLFSVKSFDDALRVFEYLYTIVQNDDRALKSFTSAFQELKAVQAQLKASHTELQVTKNNYLKQRARMVELQSELDNQLEGSAQGSALHKQISTLNEEWKHQGLPQFKQFFNKLSASFLDFQELFAKEAGANLKFDGRKGATFTLTDQSLNAFLQDKDELFHSLSFRFSTGKMIITGHKDNADVEIQGYFEQIQGNDTSIVRFTVDRLVFNGYQLPDTTIASLQNEFGMGFNSKLTVPIPIEVTSVEHQEGKLIIRLTFS